MTRPRLLDLFCGAGGCSVGYHRAGFDVVGVDLRPQPNYPFEFHQADALTWSLDGYDAIHASPPCQAYAGVTAWRGNRSSHPDLIAPAQTLLRRSGLPYVIENVPDARRRLADPIMLCGSQFRLGIRRHRYFEIHPALSVMLTPCHHKRGDHSFDHGGPGCTEREYGDAMGCPWMTVKESRNAIPPAYTEWIGGRLLEQMKAAA